MLREVYSPLGRRVRDVYKNGHIVLCNFAGIAELLNCTFKEALAIAQMAERVTYVDDDRPLMTADDFAELIEGMDDAPAAAKRVARAIVVTSPDCLIEYFYQ